jgi:hypothetical protein
MEQVFLSPIRDRLVRDRLDSFCDGITSSSQVVTARQRQKAAGASLAALGARQFPLDIAGTSGASFTHMAAPAGCR